MVGRKTQNLNKSRFLTLHVEHHAVSDPLAPVRHDAGELLFVRLAARDHHVAAPYRHRAVRVASLLQGGFPLQQCAPLDRAWRLPVGRSAGGDGHVALLTPGHDCWAR